MLFASKAAGPSEGVPEELKEVLAALKGTLAYRSYIPAISFVQRAKANPRSFISGSGQINAPHFGGGAEKTMPLTMKWSVNGLSVEGSENGPKEVFLRNFTFNGGASLNTDIQIKVGEKVVVGTSAFGDQGLVVVVTAKVL